MWIKTTDTHLFQFTIPEYQFGQKVETRDGWIGYVVGLDFYPETKTWSYGIYFIHPENQPVEEIWYEAEHLKAIAPPPPPDPLQKIQPIFDRASGNFA